MIQVAEELIEAVSGWQVLVAVAKMVLAKLAGGIAIRFQDVSDAGIQRSEAEFGTR